MSRTPEVYRLRFPARGECASAGALAPDPSGFKMGRAMNLFSQTTVQTLICLPRTIHWFKRSILAKSATPGVSASVSSSGEA